MRNEFRLNHFALKSYFSLNKRRALVLRVMLQFCTIFHSGLDWQQNLWYSYVQKNVEQGSTVFTHYPLPYKTLRRILFYSEFSTQRSDSNNFTWYEWIFVCGVKVLFCVQQFETKMKIGREKRRWDRITPLLFETKSRQTEKELNWTLRSYLRELSLTKF